MNKNDYSLYENEHHRYKNLTNNLFYYQKYKDNPWVKGENFGDYLSKIIVGEMALKNNLKEMKLSNKRLLSIGSILHFAKDNDIIWGSGINGKIELTKLNFMNLDIKAVRGPLTKEILEKKGIPTPEVFGDPALLLPEFFSDLKYMPIKNKIIVIPNLNELEECRKLIPAQFQLVSPFLHWTKVVNEILSSEIVFTSSLHGLIVSEAFRVPVVLFKPFGGETLFKYEDYLEGTGRKLNQDFKSFNQLFREKDGIKFSPMKFNAEALKSVFPICAFE